MEVFCIWAVKNSQIIQTKKKHAVLTMKLKNVIATIFLSKISIQNQWKTTNFLLSCYYIPWLSPIEQINFRPFLSNIESPWIHQRILKNTFTFATIVWVRVSISSKAWWVTFFLSPRSDNCIASAQPVQPNAKGIP